MKHDNIFHAGIAAHSTLVILFAGIFGASVGILGATLALTLIPPNEDHTRRVEIGAMEKRITANADQAHAQIARNIQALSQRFDRHLENHPGPEER